MKPELLVYYPFLENEKPSVVGWNKATVKYITENRSKVHQVIRDMAKRLGKSYLHDTEIDDIYSDVLLYMYKRILPQTP